MKMLLLFTCLLTLICSPALAGKNAGGAMVVHTGHEDLIFTDFNYDFCQDFEDYAPTTCEELSHESTFVDAVGLLGAMIWYVAAFHPDTSPGVTVIYFGHDHNFSTGFIGGWGFCGPANTLEIPDGGWPDDPNAGNSIAFGSPVAGDHLFPFYWLGCYGDTGNYIGTTINPTGGYAGFVSDDNPGVLDEITRFG